VEWLSVDGSRELREIEVVYNGDDVEVLEFEEGEELYDPLGPIDFEQALVGITEFCRWASRPRDPFMGTEPAVDISKLEGVRALPGRVRSDTNWSEDDWAERHELLMAKGKYCGCDLCARLNHDSMTAKGKYCGCDLCEGLGMRAWMPDMTGQPFGSLDRTPVRSSLGTVPMEPCQCEGCQRIELLRSLRDKPCPEVTHLRELTDLAWLEMRVLFREAGGTESEAAARFKWLGDVADRVELMMRFLYGDRIAHRGRVPETSGGWTAEDVIGRDLSS